MSKKIDVKMLFQGKRKYITIGAIVLVAGLAIWSNKRGGGSTGDAARPIPGGVDYSSVASGAAPPGLTIADVQSAIGDYAKKDQESTAKMMDQMSKQNTDALSGIMDGFNKAMNQQGTNFTNALDSLAKSNQAQWDQMARQQQDQWSLFQRELNDLETHQKNLQTSFAEQLANMMRQQQTYSSGSSGSSSSYSGSSSRSSSSSSSSTKYYDSSVTSGSTTTYYNSSGDVIGRSTPSTSSNWSSGAAGGTVSGTVVATKKPGEDWKPYYGR